MITPGESTILRNISERITFTSTLCHRLSSAAWCGPHAREKARAQGAGDGCRAEVTVLAADRATGQSGWGAGCAAAATGYFRPHRITRPLLHVLWGVLSNSGTVAFFPIIAGLPVGCKKNRMLSSVPVRVFCPISPNMVAPII